VKPRRPEKPVVRSAAQALSILKTTRREVEILTRPNDPIVADAVAAHLLTVIDVVIQLVALRKLDEEDRQKNDDAIGAFLTTLVPVRGPLGLPMLHTTADPKPKRGRRK
jgi:hypothetical protein